MEMSTIPPKPSDIYTYESSQPLGNPHLTFKDKLLRGEEGIDKNISVNSSILESVPNLDATCTQVTELTTIKKKKRVTLSQDDRNRMYMPWKFSVIIKLKGKQILHQILKK